MTEASENLSHTGPSSLAWFGLEVLDVCAKQGTVQVTSPILSKKPLPPQKSALPQPLEDFSNPAGAVDPHYCPGGVAGAPATGSFNWPHHPHPPPSTTLTELGYFDSCSVDQFSG